NTLWVSLDRVAIDSTTIKAGKEELVGYDEYKHIKGAKIYAVISREALPLSIQRGLAVSITLNIS
ncbi:MAG: hypothetical protein QXP91_13050, partial [Candidatus Methanomethylicia archaeon]